MKLKTLVQDYIGFVEMCWARLHQSIPLARQEELIPDWLQYHWEIFLEQPLREGNPTLFLEFYGDGSENENGRVFMPSARATHRLCFHPLSENCLEDLIDGKPIHFLDTGLPVDRFVSCQPGEWFREEPPFNAILAASPNSSSAEAPLVFRLEEVEFSLKPII